VFLKFQNIIVGERYVLRFSFADRGTRLCSGCAGTAKLSVLLDGQRVVGPLEGRDTTWSNVEFNVTALATQITIQFINEGEAGDRSVFLDSVSFDSSEIAAFSTTVNMDYFFPSCDIFKFASILELLYTVCDPSSSSLSSSSLSSLPKSYSSSGSRSLSDGFVPLRYG
jgi:hypothetical protein